MTLHGFTVSVVICAYTEERWDDFLESVESVQQQTVAALETIVVVDHNEKLLERAINYFKSEAVKIIRNNESRGASGARNSGVALARGEIIAFLDDDAIANPNWIKSLLEGYQHQYILGVGGAVEPLWLSRKRPIWFPNEFDWVIGSTYRGMPVVTTPVRNLWTCNMSLRKKVFDQAGGFRAEFGKVATKSRPEDTEICIRILQNNPEGIWLYKPDAFIQHKVPTARSNWKYYLVRCYNEGVGKAELVQLLGKNDSLVTERSYLRQTIPKGIVGGLVETFFGLKPAGVIRAMAITVGLIATIWGYLTYLVTQQLKKVR